MYKPILIIMILNVMNFINLYAQRSTFKPDPCEKKVYWMDDVGSRDYDTIYNSFLIRYVKKEFPDALNNITWEEKGLLPFKRIVCIDTLCKFILNTEGGLNFELNMNLRYQTYDLSIVDSTIIEIYDCGQENRYVYTIDRKKYYGMFERLSPSQTTLAYRKIENIKLNFNNKIVNVPSDLLADLINPNTCYQYHPIQPIQGYYDSTKESVYIYVWSDTYHDSFLDTYAGNAYAAKIIIDANGECSRIVLRGHDLRVYGWLECPYFWVF